MRPGMSCAVEILIEELADALYVPVQAVFRDGRSAPSPVVAHAATERRDVQVGRYNELWVQILAGLTEGETVLLQRADRHFRRGRAEARRGRGTGAALGTRSSRGASVSSAWKRARSGRANPRRRGSLAVAAGTIHMPGRDVEASAMLAMRRCSVVLFSLIPMACAAGAPADPASAAAPAREGSPPAKPNILVIFGDDIGIANVSAYSDGVMGYDDAEHRPHRRGGRSASCTTTASRAAPPAAPRSSPASTASAPA